MKTADYNKVKAIADSFDNDLIYIMDIDGEIINFDSIESLADYLNK